jgi:hypothetical protein
VAWAGACNEHWTQPIRAKRAANASEALVQSWETDQRGLVARACPVLVIRCNSGQLRVLSHKRRLSISTPHASAMGWAMVAASAVSLL